MINESAELEQRYVKFNVDKLCEVVRSVAGDGVSEVREIDKMEGGFNKALLMTLANGKQVVAKIPCPNAGPARYSTASEAAMLTYGKRSFNFTISQQLITSTVRSHTSVPVPRLLDWNADKSNPVGAEYLIMDKAPGVQLYKVWDQLPNRQQHQLIKNLTALERQLSSIRFPAYGNLYFRTSVPNESCISLDASIDPNGFYCVGRIANHVWYGNDHSTDAHPADVGPCKYPNLRLLRVHFLIVL